MKAAHAKCVIVSDIDVVLMQFLCFVCVCFSAL